MALVTSVRNHTFTIIEITNGIRKPRGTIKGQSTLTIETIKRTLGHQSTSDRGVLALICQDPCHATPPDHGETSCVSMTKMRVKRSMQFRGSNNDNDRILKVILEHDPTTSKALKTIHW